MSISDVLVNPIVKVRKPCLCCGEEMELLFMKIGISVTVVLKSFVEKFSIRKMTE